MRVEGLHSAQTVDCIVGRYLVAAERLSTVTVHRLKLTPHSFLRAKELRLKLNQ